MTDTQPTFSTPWTRERAALLAIICLAAGIAGGWLIRGLQNPMQAHIANAVPAQPVASPTPKTPDPGQLKAMADAQAAPLIEQLKSTPDNPELLTSIGNLYYDAQQYSTAVDYYGRSLKSRPSDAAVRTDMGTAYWYMSNTDAAIAAFDRALTYAPNNPNTLFNRGLVKWQGKHDTAGAVADWEKLLATNPNYEQKDKVQQMLADVKTQAAAAQGINAK